MFDELQAQNIVVSVSTFRFIIVETLNHQALVAPRVGPEREHGACEQAPQRPVTWSEVHIVLLRESGGQEGEASRARSGSQVTRQGAQSCIAAHAAEPQVLCGGFLMHLTS